MTGSCWYVSRVCPATLSICCYGVQDSWVRLQKHLENKAKYKSLLLLTPSSFGQLCFYLFFSSGIRAYEHLGFRAFGHPGKIIAAVVITLHNIGGYFAIWIGCESRWWKCRDTGVMTREARSINVCLFPQRCPVTCSLWSLSYRWSSRLFSAKQLDRSK